MLCEPGKKDVEAKPTEAGPRGEVVAAGTWAALLSCHGLLVLIPAQDPCKTPLFSFLAGSHCSSFLQYFTSGNSTSTYWCHVSHLIYSHSLLTLIPSATRFLSLSRSLALTHSHSLIPLSLTLPHLHCLVQPLSPGYSLVHLLTHSHPVILSIVQSHPYSHILTPHSFPFSLIFTHSPRRREEKRSLF